MIKENKKLSIIVPVYNAEKYMEKCLDRLLEQKVQPFIIVGRLQKDKKIDYSKYNDLKIRYKYQ